MERLLHFLDVESIMFAERIVGQLPLPSKTTNRVRMNAEHFSDLLRRNGV